ncbi:MAG: glycosyltransferase family 2 protein [Clostridia bacterium]|nr:glycosyltransferase family 2 protein [Clostridia bacterium]
MKTLIIIPAYNERENIKRVITNLTENYPKYDYVIINDCSTDDTEKICKENGFNYVSLPANLGIGGGVQTGYKYALKNGYDIAVQMDGDGQHDPAFLDELTSVIERDEADIVIGSRFITKEGFQSSGMRRFGIKFLSLLIKLCSGADIKDVTSGYRAVNRRFIEIYSKDYADDYPEPEAIVAARMYGGRLAEVPVIMNERMGGVSSINPIKSVYYMIKVSLSILFFRITFKGGNRK